MMSTKHRFIFLHPPKTAGTTLARALADLSEDVETPVVGRDYIDSFGLVGPVTRTKHMTLREYLIRGNGEFDDYKVGVALRHPLARMLSLYFDAGRWIRPRIPGGGRLSAKIPSPLIRSSLLRVENPTWDFEQFQKMVSIEKNQADFLRLPNGSLREPDWIFDSRHPMSSINEFRTMVGATPLDHVETLNQSVKPSEVARLLKDRELAKTVYQWHTEDYVSYDFPLMGR